jgi:uncharacterized membrane protein YcaP (DUF421 family)
METILKAILGYFFLLITVRLLSRRPGAQMTPFEFVIIFFIGGIIIQSIISGDGSMTNAVCTVLTIGMMHRLVAYLKQRYPRFGALADGTPLVLLERGSRHTEVMEKMRIQDTDLMAAGRGNGLERLEQIKYAILERNGGISVIKAEE